MQAITTKYLGPTNFRGSRVVAKAQAGRITIDWDHALDPEDNHIAAAQALAVKLGWTEDRALEGPWVGGEVAGGEGYAFVRVTEYCRFTASKGA